MDQKIFEDGNNHSDKKSNCIDSTGKRVGRLLVVEKADDYVSPKGKHTPRWLCRCDCGKTALVYEYRLKMGTTKSCGCISRERFVDYGKSKLKDLIGQRFGRLVVAGLTEKRIKQGNVIWLCQCDCGNQTEVSSLNLRNGSTQSCGCLQKERVSERSRKPEGHALSNYLFDGYKASAKKRNVSFLLTLDQFRELTKQDCYYCGVEPGQILKHGKCWGEYIYNGIDRINSDKGYEIDNVVPCCKNCNYAKQSLTREEFFILIEKIYLNLKTNHRL